MTNFASEKKQTEQNSSVSNQNTEKSAKQTSSYKDQRAVTTQFKNLQNSANASKQGQSITQLQAKASQSTNNKLPEQLKNSIEHLSGLAMDDVSVHKNSNKPAQLQAHAFAQGNEIHLGPGQEKHLAHEAWHVVQQKQQRVKPTTQLKNKTPINDDETLEKEADIMGAKALQIKRPDPQWSPLQTKSKTDANSGIVQGNFKKPVAMADPRDAFQERKTMEKRKEDVLPATSTAFSVEEEKLNALREAFQNTTFYYGTTGGAKGRAENIQNAAKMMGRHLTKLRMKKRARLHEAKATGTTLSDAENEELQKLDAEHAEIEKIKEGKLEKYTKATLPTHKKILEQGVEKDVLDAHVTNNRGLYLPGNRVEGYLDNKPLEGDANPDGTRTDMMDNYYGGTGDLASKRSDPIAEFVHNSMGYHGTYEEAKAAEKSGRDSYKEKFPGKEGWDPTGALFAAKKPELAAVNSNEDQSNEVVESDEDLSYRPTWGGNPINPGITGTMEISRHIREGVKTLGGTIVFEGGGVTWNGSFVASEKAGDTNIEAIYMMPYLAGKETAVVPFGAGKICFQFHGKDIKPTRKLFRDNWFFGQKPQDQVVEDRANKKIIVKQAGKPEVENIPNALYWQFPES